MINCAQDSSKCSKYWDLDALGSVTDSSIALDMAYKEYNEALITERHKSCMDRLEDE